ncbi:MAG: CvpA family protein [Caulobacteraceae bacterium]|nr:CvpA family protein [Caulobacter sp.]
MTGFDIFAILAVLVSALIGYARGVIREVVTLCAFAAAAIAAIAALPFAAPALRHVIHPGWAAAAAAVAIMFILVYVLVRTLGGMLARHLERARLGALDRWGGAAFGVLRGAIFLGILALVVQATPWPQGERPRWIVDGLTWPATQKAGRTLVALAPVGGGAATRFGRFFKQGVSAGFQPSIDEATGNTTGGVSSDEGVVLRSADGDESTPRNRTAARRKRTAYEETSRQHVDDLVERTR